jgi:hypothetical protein
VSPRQATPGGRPCGTRSARVHGTLRPCSVTDCDAGAAGKNHLVDFWVRFQEPGQKVEIGITPLGGSFEFADHWFGRLLTDWLICVFGGSGRAGGSLCRAVAHGPGHGPIGAAVAAWSAVALVGSYELLMMIIRSAQVPAGARATWAGSPVALSQVDRHACRRVIRSRGQEPHTWGK